MITIHCTKKLLSRLSVGVGEQLRSEYSHYFAANDATPTLLSGWHGHLVTLQRRPCGLLVHDTTRFAVFIPALKKDDFASFDHHFSDSFMNTLLRTGAEDELMEAAVSQLAPLMIENTINRSVLGTINQMVQHIQFAIEDGDVTISEFTGYRIGAWQADTPWSAKGIKWAIWAASVLHQLRPRINEANTISLYAGEKYREFLVEPLKNSGKTIEIPLQGMRFGEQLQWFNRQAEVTQP